jgi:hypothetical protein
MVLTKCFALKNLRLFLTYVFFSESVANPYPSSTPYTFKHNPQRFGFADKHKLPFTFVSASDGCNVVKVFRTAIEAGLRYRCVPVFLSFFTVNSLPLNSFSCPF